MYANVTRESGPAMTWSMFAANYLHTAEYSQAHEYFERGYKSYVRPEFKVWSETPIGYEGSANFLTGIGGFLQALIFGYGGLDFVRDGNRTTMILSGSMTPPNVDEVEVNYIRYGKSKCQWIFRNAYSGMDCGKSLQKLEMVQGGKRTLLGSSFNCKLWCSNSLFTIIPHIIGSVSVTRGDPPKHIHILR